MYTFLFFVPWNIDSFGRFRFGSISNRLVAIEGGFMIVDIPTWGHIS